jgi:muramoyltetrapeptide carboxypeptidase
LSAIFRPCPAVYPGDRVAVIAPASGFDRAAFDAGLALVDARYESLYGPGIFERERYLAGSDGRRLEELNAALADPEVRALFCARGGYGATRLLGRLRDADPGAAAKLLIGFSDITALHLWMQAHGRMSIHGPVLTQLGRLPQATCERLFGLLESSSPPAALRGAGTPFMPAIDGAVLLLEDQGERPYRLDRMWTHLALAGVFARIRGIVLGTFTGCEEPDAPYGSADVLRELAEATGLPCAAGFPIGHGDVNEPVPLGAAVRLDADSATLTFLQAAVTG